MTKNAFFATHRTELYFDKRKKKSTIVFHGRTQKIRPYLCPSVKVEVDEKSRNIIKLRLKNEKKKLRVFFTLPWTAKPNFELCFPTLKNHGAIFRSQHVSSLTGTSSYTCVLIVRVGQSLQESTRDVYREVTTICTHVHKKNWCDVCSSHQTRSLQLSTSNTTRVRADSSP